VGPREGSFVLLLAHCPTTLAAGRPSVYATEGNSQRGGAHVVKGLR
jgi:hypothetical protein